MECLYVCIPIDHCPSIVEITAAGLKSANKKSEITTCKAKKKVVCCRA